MEKDLQSARLQDGMTGGVFMAVGLGAIFLSLGYRGASGVYPGFLGGALALFGGILFLRAWLGQRLDEAVRPLTDNTVHLALAIGGTAAYLALIPYLGFYTSSFALLLGMPLMLGFRRAVFLVICSAVFIVLVYCLFSALLERPLPSELFPILLR